VTRDTIRSRTPRRSRGPAAGLALALLVLAATAAGASDLSQGRMDLNQASLEEILTLPVPEEVARRIWEHRTYVRYFGNIYELREIEGLTADMLDSLKPLVATIPPDPADASVARLAASYRQVSNFLGEEGASEGLADEYLDKLRMPENLNKMDLYDLMSYQNVSPVDATAILKSRDRLGSIESQRQLRGANGLRYYSYRTLRDFVIYDDAELEAESRRDVTGYVQTRYWETPFSSGDDELGNFASGRPRGRYTVDQVALFQPAWLTKIRVNHRDGYQAGILRASEYGERDWDETSKGYVSIQDQHYGDFRLKSAVVGNFRVAYGLGLVMDNTDYIKFRKTGFGWDKRLLGVHGDLSRSYEYHLTGAAFEGSYGPLNASFFVSSDRKDGILNADGTINRYVIMQPRPPADWLEERTVDGVPTGLRRDAFQEDMIGGNVKLMLAPGSYIGVSGYEARYDKAFRADETTLVQTTDLLETRDAEIWNAYTSVYTDAEGEIVEDKFRRVLGAEGQVVVANVAVQGEYAFMQAPHDAVTPDGTAYKESKLFSSENPDAYVINAFAQWDNLHLLAIYRDYDIGFDNPYGRAFSNDSRYEMTLLDAPYRLNDDLYTWLETTGPQPKAEKGLFLDMRYRISRNLILSGLQFDQWTRKADGADLMRYTIKGEYQPIFNLRLRVRHRYSSRSEMDLADVRKFRNWETRWQAIYLLSNYNRLGFMYMTSNVMFPPRPRLSGTPDAGVGDPAVGGAGAPGHGFEVRYEHNLTPGIKLSFASSVYDGFLWNFEGNEFVLLDGNGFRNWFKVESRVSDRLLFQLKVTRDHNLPRAVDVRLFGDPSGNDPDAPYVPVDDTIVRMQMDYTF
jgi:DNA uptake protein ComE-like DNA-binding protein